MGVLCFIKADWPQIGGAFTTRGVHVAWPKRLAQLITNDEAEGVHAGEVGSRLEELLKPA